MRYEDWDVLLFPRSCKIPIKEFRVACHVVHDAEFSHTHGTYGIPTMCCFVPSLAVGAPFQVSIHSWYTPAVSQYTQTYSQYSENVTFEARLFIDGRLVASTTLDRMNTWPHIIAHSFQYLKPGNSESLRFPSFRRELLQQSFWSPADDIGRIKIVIGEGFPRDSHSMPVERIKNIVAFSFQHAPSEVLERSGIAWPNSMMWRRAPFASSMPAPTYPSEEADSYAHSPHRRTDLIPGHKSNFSVIPGTNSNPPVGLSSRRVTHPICNSLPAVAGTRNVDIDTFGGTNSYFEFLNVVGTEPIDTNRAEAHENNQQKNTRKSSTDISMPDYISMEAGDRLALPLEQPFLVAGMRQEVSSDLRVPANTPTAGGQSSHEQDVPVPLLSSSIPSDLANSLTHSLLNQPMPLHFQQPNFHAPAGEIKSRKENQRQKQTGGQSLSTLGSGGSTTGIEHQEMRRVSQQMYVPSSTSMSSCRALSRANSPQGHDCSEQQSQRVISMEVEAGNTPLKDSSQVGVSFEKRMKRSRNFTPASMRAIDLDEDLRRDSPRARLTPFVSELNAAEK